MFKIIIDYLLSSSLHGFYFIAEKRFHWAERLFWIICVASSWTGSVILMVNSVHQYQNQGITFTVDTFYLGWVTDFPSVIISEKGNSKISKLKYKWFAGDKNIGTKSAIAEQLSFEVDFFNNKDNCEIGKPTREGCLQGNYSFYMNELKSSCTEIFSSCFYNDEEFICCDEFLPVPCYYGICFAANNLAAGSKLPFKITRNDYGRGNLSIELINHSVRIYALSQDSVPSKLNAKNLINRFLVQETLPLVTNYNYEVYLSMQVTDSDPGIKYLSADKRSCLYSEENYLKTSEVHSESACDNECLSEAQKKICNCSHHALPGNTPEMECKLDGILCIHKNAKAIESMTKGCDCLKSCFYTEIFYVGCTREVNERFRSKKSVLRLNFIIFPPSERFTRNIVKAPLDMIVSVGGTAGLFIGASILTIIEVLYYLFVRPIGDKYKGLKQPNKLPRIEKTARKITVAKNLDNRIETSLFPFIN